MTTDLTRLMLADISLHIGLTMLTLICIARYVRIKEDETYSELFHKYTEVLALHTAERVRHEVEIRRLSESIEIYKGALKERALKDD